MSRLRTEALQVSYGAGPVVNGIDLALPAGEITAIIGPNGCGKSTLLRAFARLLSPLAGVVLLDGSDVHRRATREVARELGLLPQGATTPDGLTVEDLVARGRYPHRGRWRPWSADDQQQVDGALEQTTMCDLRDRLVDQLSGGQRQRAWIAMALAQDTPTMLLDEPTTYLDLAHQIEVLDLLARLNRERGRTIVLVLHDLNEAARYADRIVAMRDGRIAADGPPAAVLTAGTVERVFGLRCQILEDPETGAPLVIPSARQTAPHPAPRPAAMSPARCPNA
ncbi:MAG: ABC transporter ATP-binding protein [Actinobacteria bacterium]|nr:ABC transporter ATP-binding protein [Actinomycetota bacterium]